MCGQVALDDTRYGRFYVGQELAVVVGTIRPSCTRWATCGLSQVNHRGLRIHIPVSMSSPYMTCCVTDILDTVSTDIKRGHCSC